MYPDDVAPSRLQRFLNASWPVFRAFGVDVRVHWSIVVVPLALFGVLREAHYETDVAIQAALAGTFALYLTVWVHEMGHILTGRKFGVPARLITLSPLGGLAHMESRAPSPQAEIWIAAAGPLTQAAFTALLAVPYFVFGLGESAQFAEAETWRRFYLWFVGWQISTVVFNLLPCYPFDGGRVLRGFLSTRMHSNKASLRTAYVGFAGALVLGLLGVGILFQLGDGVFYRTWGVLLVWMGVGNFFACRQLQREAQHADSAYEPVEAWKQGRSDDAWKSSLAESERLSREEERRERRIAEARREEENARRRLQERVDELLDRINEVGGLKNLSAAEQRELAEASELLRRETAGN